jgi:hypothetical protein
VVVAGKTELDSVDRKILDDAFVVVVVL